MKPRQVSQFLNVVEKRLGWVPTRFNRDVTARKVTEKVESNPDLYTLRNLLMAVELLAREKQERTPMGVFAHVERAQSVARDKDTDVEAAIQDAIRIEQHRGDPDGWVVRFARATGWWRTEAYKEWRNEQAKPR